MVTLRFAPNTNPGRSRLFRRTNLAVSLLASLLLCLTHLPANAADTAADATIVVTLLGTGTPALSPTRFGPSTLVQAGGLNLVFDAGRGSTIRMMQAGVPPGRVDALFITHFHSDHVNGFSDLWMAGYMANAGGSRKLPLQVYGPAGVKNISDHMMLAFQADTDTRTQGGRIPVGAEKIDSHEFDSDSVIFDQAGVRVSAFKVSHIEPSYGYRIDYRDRSVLISGDTSFDQNLIAHGEGVDLLVHQVRMRPPGSDNGIHTLPEDAGRIFTATGTRMGVYSHIVLGGGNGSEAEKLEQLRARTRQTYDGPLTIGEDLQRFIVGDEVSVTSLTPN